MTTIISANQKEDFLFAWFFCSKFDIIRCNSHKTSANYRSFITEYQHQSRCKQHHVVFLLCVYQQFFGLLCVYQQLWGLLTPHTFILHIYWSAVSPDTIHLFDKQHQVVSPHIDLRMRRLHKLVTTAIFTTACS